MIQKTVAAFDPEDSSRVRQNVDHNQAIVGFENVSLQRNVDQLCTYEE
jgi:hypothetical protein